MSVDVKKIVSVSKVEPSKKFPGRSLVTCDYLGNPSYQFLADGGEVKTLSKKEFNPEDAPIRPAKPTKKKTSKTTKK